MTESLHQPTGASPLLAIVVPCYNEAAALPTCHRRLTEVLDGLDVTSEIIYVDDGSVDGSHRWFETMAHRPEVRIVQLSRNFGKEAAVTAGLDASRAQATVVLDADLQDPPEWIPAMLEAWREGADVVNMRRRRRLGESLGKRWSSSLFYRLMWRLSQEVPLAVDVGDFRLLDRQVIDAVCQLPESQRYMKGIVSWVGFRQETLEYDREPRVEGNSKWPFGQLFRLAMAAVTGYSTRPLRIMTYTALAATVAGLPLLAAMFSLGLLGPVSALVLGSLTIQLGGMALIGEYLASIAQESKHRPLYLLRRRSERDPARGLNVVTPLQRSTG